jgi:KaiC/GvpD/RAD55 family RecA-like ATPase
MIPNELAEFFKVKGRTLLVKGVAGTGKTLFGFNILKESGEYGNAMWVNSRDMDSADFSELERVVPDRRRINAARREKNVESSDPELTESGIIETLYDEIAEIENPMVVIDSFDGLTTDLKESEKERLRIDLVRLARDTGARVVVIIETFEPNPLDYLADGIVTLIENSIEARRVREIYLNKLRGTVIKQPKYPFTLVDGKYQGFAPFEVEPIAHPVIPPPRQDFRNKISTGIEHFDVILDGGYQKGSANLLEVGEGVGNAYYWLVVPTIINNLNLRRGLMHIPSEGRSRAMLYNFIHSHVGKKYINSLVISLGNDERIPKSTPNVFPSKGKDIHRDLEPLLLARERLSKKEPTLSLIGLDTLEHTYGVEDAHRMVANFVSETERRKGVDLFLANQGQQIIDRISHLVGTHWKILNLHKSIVMYGIVPRTEVFNVSVDMTKEFIETKLTAIL